MSNTKFAVELIDVFFQYQDETVLEGITLQIKEKEFLAVLGPNGGGKTTLLKLVLGLIKPHAGKVRLFGKRPRANQTLVGYVPQHAHIPRHFPIAVEEVVLMGRLRGHSLGVRSSKDDRAAAENAMRSVEILDLRDRRLDTLSGGQHQRVLIARALVSEPKILILDEPTASVDNRVEQGIFDLLRQLNREKTIMLVTHDLGFVSRYVTRVACLNKQLVCHHAGEITGEDIKSLYGDSVKMVRHECEI